MNDVLAIILGGGRGRAALSSHAAPLQAGGTDRRQVPLIDIPISSCLHSEIRRIFILTQFNSASLNRHIGQTLPDGRVLARLRRDPCRGQTPESWDWFRAPPTPSGRRGGTSSGTGRTTILILAGDHLYRMDYTEMIDAHIDRDADITIAAQPVDKDDAL